MIFTPDDQKHPFDDVTVSVVAGVSAVASVSSVAGVHCNVAVPDLGSSVFFTPGSRIRDEKINPDPENGITIQDHIP
jgi:hypothetical protein